MNLISIILIMIFLHIVDDFYLQVGWLSNGKQKSWWAKNAPHELYKYDYIWALIMHSFSWTFMIMLPLMYVLKFELNLLFCMAFIVNMLIHGFIDDLKANKMKINLIQDQLIHIFQIITTVIILT